MEAIRYGTADDVALITGQRRRMFADNSFGSDQALGEADAAFEPWVRERLSDGRYVGLLLEDGGEVVAGAGIFFADFPPHWMHSQAARAYVLNVYTSPGARVCKAPDGSGAGGVQAARGVDGGAACFAAGAGAV